MTDRAGALLGPHKILSHQAFLDGLRVWVQSHLEVHELRVALQELQHEQLDVARRQHVDCKLVGASRNGLGHCIVFLEGFGSIESYPGVLSMVDCIGAVDILAMLQHTIPKLRPAPSGMHPSQDLQLPH